MKNKKAIRIPQITTLEEADAHQRKHGFKPLLSKLQETVDKVSAKLRGKRREMNKTEREFMAILEAQKRKGDIVDYKFEGVRLGWGDCMVYKPDFTVRKVAERGRLILKEVKGAHIRDRDIVRFKGCRAEWKDWFDFEMWQKKGGQWNRLL